MQDASVVLRATCQGRELRLPVCPSVCTEFTSQLCFQYNAFKLPHTHTQKSWNFSTRQPFPPESHAAPSAVDAPKCLLPANRRICQIPQVAQQNDPTVETLNSVELMVPCLTQLLFLVCTQYYATSLREPTNFPLSWQKRPELFQTFSCTKQSFFFFTFVIVSQRWWGRGASNG